MNKKIFNNYLSNRCTNKEFDEFVHWINKNAITEEEKNWYFEDWNSFHPDLQNKNQRKYDDLLQAIHQVLWKNKQQIITLNRLTEFFGRAAAILFIPVLLVLAYMISLNKIHTAHYNDLVADSLEIIAPIGSRTLVHLSDGSHINLNYGSTIKYPQIFTGDKREVILTGEGYFDVAHNPDKPFIVKVGKLNVKALGTRFNVQAYPDDDVVETTLEEGKVILERTSLREKNETIAVLDPGQHTIFHLNSGKVYTANVNVNNYTAWKDGKLIFDNEPITGVAEKLSRMFNVEIEVAENARDYSYTVTFLHDPLFLILDLMTETTPIRYYKLPRKKNADGTYAKQRIRIERRKKRS